MKKKDSIVDINTIVDLAKEENWQKVDDLLSQHAGQQELFDWARGSLSDPDSNLRDLAASILEQTNLPLEDVVIEGLFGLMGEVDENNPYPSFRAACALAKRYEDGRVLGKIAEVESKLQCFVEDEEVTEIAKGYLEKIGQSKNS